VIPTKRYTNPRLRYLTHRHQDADDIFKLLGLKVKVTR